MNKEKSRNFLIASNLIFVYSGLGLFLIILMRKEYTSPLQIIAAAGLMLLWGGFGFLVRKGIRWTRYVLLIFALAAIIMGIPQALTQLQGISIIILVLQTITLLIATIYSFTSSRILNK